MPFLTTSATATLLQANHLSSGLCRSSSCLISKWQPDYPFKMELGWCHFSTQNHSYSSRTESKTQRWVFWPISVVCLTSQITDLISNYSHSLCGTHTGFLRPFSLGLCIGLSFCLECSFPDKYKVSSSAFFKSSLKCHSHGEPPTLSMLLKIGTCLPFQSSFPALPLLCREKRKCTILQHTFYLSMAYCLPCHIPTYHSLHCKCKLHGGRIFLYSLMYLLFKIVPDT